MNYVPLIGIAGVESERLYHSANEVIIGGVNSPSRSFKAVGGGSPVFFNRAEGSYLWDVDDKKYIDYLAAYGPLIVGHAHPKLIEAITTAATHGTLYGVPTFWEIDFARQIRGAIPSMERIRFTNSGTEAVMTTIRVARGYTGRNKIIKCAGCYHGHADLVLVAAGSGPATLGIPDSAGIPTGLAQDVITVPFNNVQAMEEAFRVWGDQVAALLLEPIVGNFGMVMPHEGYLEQVCAIARKHGALVIFDEVITAFRFHFGGAQNAPFFPDHDAIRPDLTALGKIIGGGLPIGAYGGKQEIMEKVAPLGPVYQAGTMAGNPASIRTGIACLDILSESGTYEKMKGLSDKLVQGLRELATKYSIPLLINQIGAAFSTHFGVSHISNYDEAQAADGEMFAKFFRGMLEEGILLAPSKYEAWFLTLAHTDQDILDTLTAAEKVMKNVN